MLSADSFGTLSYGIASIPRLDAFGFSGVKLLRPWSSSKVDAVLAWGNRPSTQRAVRYCERRRTSLWRIEDGFVRSFGTGKTHPPLSVVVDPLGIYYDSQRPSLLEAMLQSDVRSDEASDALVISALGLLRRYALSKYNNSGVFEGFGSALLDSDQHRPRVLVVDQTFGDMSIEYAMARAGTFRQMLDAALDENPDALIVVKTHPETAAGRKGGHFHDIPNDRRILVIKEAVQPASLLALVDSVYVVSSTLGFEALMAGKQVHCFGMPWYAGWGATVDRQKCPRRSRTRSVDELFAAAYLRYTRYINPETGGPGTIFDVIRWLARQRKMAGLDRTPCSMT